jgi:thiol:disulfide interchange protein DsbC
MMKRLVAAVLACAALFAGAAYADEAAIKRSVEAIFPGVKVESVKKTPYLGLYEVRAGSELIYTDEKVTYIITGDIIEAKTKKNLTQERLNRLAQINFAELPLELAVKQVRGSGKRVIATFEDPNCGYCKKLAKDMQNMTDVTIYTFLYPILSPDSTEKSKAIWCSPDKVKAWNDWMVNGVSPSAKGDCGAPIEKVVEIGQKLNIRGTPTIFLSNGARLPGAVPLARLEQEMAASAGGK